MDLAPSSDDMSYVSETSANDDVGAESGMSVASSSDSDCAIHVVGIPTQTNTVHRMTKSLAFQSHSLFKRSLFLRVFQPVFAGGAASSRSSRGSDSSKSSGAPRSKLVYIVDLSSRVNAAAVCQALDKYPCFTTGAGTDEGPDPHLSSVSRHACTGSCMRAHGQLSTPPMAAISGTRSFQRGDPAVIGNASGQIERGFALKF